MMQFKTPRLLFLTSIILVIGLVQQAQGQLLIDNFTPQANDRFTNDSSFILNGSDVSGVGRVNSGLGRWATAISRNVVVSAYHARPLDTATIEFHTNNDPNGPTVTRGISSSFRVPQSSSLGNDSDLWVGVLDSNLPSSIASYDLFSTSTPISSTPPDPGSVFGTLNTNLPNEIDNELAFVFGQPENGNLFSGQAVGTNRITGFFEDATVGAGTLVDLETTDFLFAIVDPDGTPNNLFNETAVQVGDSGAPVFLRDDATGGLTLLGVNGFAANDDPDTAVVEISGIGIEYFGNEASFIDAFVVANAVPEPSSALALSAMMGMFLVRRRRS